MRVALFYREHCPNCPPVKEYIASRYPDAELFNCDEPEGFGKAQASWVASTPTVIFYGDGGEEKARCHNVEECKRLSE